MAVQQTINQQLASVNTTLANLNIDKNAEDMFLTSSGEQKLSQQATKLFSDVYTPEYERTKDIQFTVDDNTNTSQTGDRAFYVFNPAREAEKKAKQELDSIAKANLAYDEQQKRILAYKEGIQKANANQSTNYYITQQLAATGQSGLLEGIITSDSPLYNAAKAKEAQKAKGLTKKTVNGKVVYAYKDTEAANLQLESFTKTTQMQLANSPSLKTAADALYTKAIATEQKQLAKQQAQADKKAAAQANKAAKAAAKQAKKNK